MTLIKAVIKTAICLAGFAGSALAEPAVVKVAEMGALPFAELGALSGRCTLTADELQGWQELFPLTSSLVSDSLIVSLSRPVDKQLGDYHYQPGVLPTLKLVGCNDQYKVYETVLSRLPSALSSVERRLTAYVIGLNQDGRLLANTIVLTIRGDRRE